MAWRFIAQRALTGEFLERDVPIEFDELTWELSAPGALRGTVSPDVGQLRAADGDLLLQEWSTLLYAEEDGVIRWGGILISSAFDDEVWTVEAAGFTTYPHGIPYLEEFSRIGVDPARCVKEVWRHLQAQVGGDLDVIVVADPTPVRLGSPGDPAFTEVYLDGEWQRSTAVPRSRVLKDAESELSADIPYNASTIPLKDVNTTATDVAQATAASAILFRFANSKPLFEDWTWRGCPPEVTAWADTIVARYAAFRDPVRWLNSYIATHSPESKQTKAARDIRTRLTTGAPLNEDWTWPGMPEWVGTYNDGLVDDWRNDTEPQKFLSDFISFHNGKGSFTALPLPFVVNIGEEKVRVGGIDGKNLINCTRGFDGTESGKHTEGTQVTFEGTKTREVDATDPEPYLLAWYEAPDCGDELDSLVSETPYDYVETHSWDGELIRHEVRYHYPRAGRRRDDLAFVQGDNVTNVVAFESVADDYANAVVALGSGEGRKAVRSDTAVLDGRLRRVAVVSDKSVHLKARLDALTREELARRRGLLQITSVDVIDHPNAVIGSWQLGDDILVRADVPWLGTVDLWCRITGWALTGEHTARLSLVRSDSVAHGG